ncbi:hypothetical protein P8452_68572 [Trifolium repens]|nr:hypothetical protein P8452_68572 [Trifolium repens]
MENNVSIITKRVWSMIRVALFMLRKGISKGKLMMDLNMIMVKRRGKLAGKAITNLMFPHHHGGSTSRSRPHDEKRLATTREYEFSCSNTPKYKFALNNKRHRNNYFACAHAPITQEEDIVTVNVVKAVLDKTVSNNEVMVGASPVLVGYEETPKDIDTDVEVEVDKAAEAFIKRFYLQLGKQD